jgi:hypothetical protein
MQWFGILLGIAVVLALGLPPDPSELHKLHTTSEAYRLAVLALLVPYTIAWYAGFYVFTKVQEYTRFLEGSAEGKAFRSITLGLGVLAFGLMVPTIIGLVLGNLAQTHHSFQAAATIINTYVGIAFPLIALWYLSNGSCLLVDTTKVRPTLNGMRVFGMAFIALSAFYTYLVVHNYEVNHNPYHLNIILLILTVIGPYLLIWFLGLLSAYQLRIYARHVKGVLYKQALVYVAGGLAVAMAGSITIQFINSTLGARDNSLGFVLIVNYLLLLFVSAGLILMAVGAKRLQKIEEV